MLSIIQKLLLTIIIQLCSITWFNLKSLVEYALKPKKLRPPLHYDVYDIFFTVTDIL